MQVNTFWRFLASFWGRKVNLTPVFIRGGRSWRLWLYNKHEIPVQAQ